MKISEYIESLIVLNIEMWHEASKNKDINGNLRSVLPQVNERIKVAKKVRELNKKRSDIRWRIDKYFHCGANESKVDC